MCWTVPMFGVCLSQGYYTLEGAVLYRYITLLLIIYLLIVHKQGCCSYYDTKLSIYLYSYSIIWLVSLDLMYPSCLCVEPSLCLTYVCPRGVIPWREQPLYYHSAVFLRTPVHARKPFPALLINFESKTQLSTDCDWLKLTEGSGPKFTRDGVISQM